MHVPHFRFLPALACAALSIAGCQSPHPGGPANDPHAILEPISLPGDGQVLLSKMAGNWAVVRSFFPRGGGDPVLTKGECKQTMILNGRYLRSDFIFHDEGGDTTGLGTIGYDAATGAFTSFWLDSRSTRISLRQSKDPFDGRQIVLFSKALAEDGPAARQSKTTSHLEDNGRTLIHQQFSTNPDGTDRIVMELRMTKK